MPQNNGDGSGASEGLRTTLAQLGVRIGRWRIGRRTDLADAASGEPGRDRNAEASAKPGAIVRRTGPREGPGSANSVSSSELGIIILTAAALAAVSVFMVLVSAP